jgi:hypothetical protein
MQAFLAACVVAIVLAVGGYYVLNMYQQPTSVAYSTTGVRI